MQMTDSHEDVEQVLNEYMPLIRRIARSAWCSSATIDLNDLHQVGEIAVLRAIKSYDPSCGTNIRSFVSSLVRQDIYNEAARFLGVLTVDHRVTRLAAKANRLSHQGNTDEEIALILNQSGTRIFDASHVRDLRIAYNRRQQVVVENDETLDHDELEEQTIHNLLDSVPRNELERSILNLRILCTTAVPLVAQSLRISENRVYQIESDLKHRIKRAIEGIS